jgi:hypothetical protein
MPLKYKLTEDNITKSNLTNPYQTENLIQVLLTLSIIKIACPYPFLEISFTSTH